MTVTFDVFIKTATPEQKGLIANMVSAAEEEARLAREIGFIEESTRVGTYRHSDGSVTSCKDEEDVRVISAKPLRELGQVRKKMADYMREAVKLGMGELGIVERCYEKYVGEPIPSNTGNKPF